MTNDHLLIALRDLARLLRAEGVRVTVGGGYGLLPRATRRSQMEVRTRLPERLPQRGTEDIDYFLDPEIVTSAERMSAIRAALDQLGYQPTVKFMQFAMPRSVEGMSATVKIDLLAGPVAESDAALVHIKDMRVRPVNGQGLHAYLTPEAFSLAKGRQDFDIGEGDESIIVSVLHPFTYIVLKLFALRDRLARSTDTKQRYHALDLFAVWASLTDGEWDQTQAWSREYSGEMRMQEAQSICRELFGDVTSRGVIALREQMRFSNWSFDSGDPEQHVEEFRRDLIALIAEPERR